jgi:ATP-dependent DNA helicase RecG
MRPNLTWESPVQYLKTVGPVRARLLSRLGIATAGDLLSHYPRRYFDRSTVTPISRAAAGQEVTVQGQVLTAGERRARRGGTIQTVSVADSSGVLFCVWFNQSYLLRQFRSGAGVMCSGLVQTHAGRRQLVHPDYEILDTGQEGLHTGRLVPQYSLTGGLGQHWLRRLIHATLAEVLGGLPETLPAEFLRERELCGRQEALRWIHFPQTQAERQAAHRRLVYEELFLIQAVMGLRKRGHQLRMGVQLGPPGDLTRRLVRALPFQLTHAQRRVLAEILADLRSGRVMHRLLQGDVGSGKTLVALIAALFVVEQGYQAAIMAPTEVLARQHGRTFESLVAPLGVTVAALTGSTPAAERRGILNGLGRRELDLVVGTHALIQDKVQLPGLGLSVVDEQHRFGVLQRGRATRAGAEEEHPPHVLVMSATPIPRSLSLTLYGDLDLSILDEMPPGRQAIKTRVSTGEQEDSIYAQVAQEVREGRQGYVIFPVIEETEKQDLKAATVEYARLQKGVLRAFRTALLHGRLPARQKDAIMGDFARGEIDLLVATTVIEVGIDVPNATIMIIHHPERFGLAQLHQLRGRVGRGTHAATCILVTDKWLSPEARERILFFANHQDGFQLAEEDLRRRGPGDIWGVRQHGLPGFRLANPLQDAQIVKACAEDVARLLQSDPRLVSPAGRTLRGALENQYHSLLPVVASG